MMLGRFLVTVSFVIFGIGAAKAAQFVSVDALAPALGFDLASLVGVAMVILVLAFLLRSFPRLNKLMIGHG